MRFVFDYQLESASHTMLLPAIVKREILPPLPEQDVFLPDEHCRSQAYAESADMDATGT
jgi:hypothetical protein